MTGPGTTQRQDHEDTSARITGQPLSPDRDTPGRPPSVSQSRSFDFDRPPSGETPSRSFEPFPAVPPAPAGDHEVVPGRSRPVIPGTSARPSGVEGQGSAVPAADHEPGTRPARDVEVRNR